MSRRASSRRGRNAAVGGGRLAIVERAIAAFLSRWFRGDLASGNDMLDRLNTTRKLVATGTASNFTTSALFGGKRVSVHTGTQYFVSNEAATVWQVAHDGTGISWLAAFAPTNVGIAQRVMSTQTVSSPGFDLLPFSADCRSRVYNDPTFIVNNAAVITLTLNTPTYVIQTYKEGDATEQSYYHKTALVASGAVGAASGSPPAQSLSVGASATGAAATQMHLADVMFTFGTQWDAAQRALLAEYMLLRYGVS